MRSPESTIAVPDRTAKGMSEGTVSDAILAQSTAARQAHGVRLLAERAAERADRLESLAVAGRERWSEVYAARGEARRLRQLARGAV